MPVETPYHLTPADQLTLSRAMSATLELLLLDAVWTREAQLASGPDRDQSRVDSLAGIVDALDRGLTDCARLAPAVADIVGRPGSPVQRRFDALREEGFDVGEYGDRIRRVSNRLHHHVQSRAGGDTARFVAEAAALISVRREQEVAGLRAKYAELGAGTSSGDMSEEMGVAVTAVAIAAGMEFGPVGYAVVEAAAAIVDCLT